MYTVTVSIINNQNLTEYNPLKKYTYTMSVVFVWRMLNIRKSDFSEQ